MNKKLLNFEIIGLVIIIFLFGYYLLLERKVQYNSELGEFNWQDKAPLIVITTHRPELGVYGNMVKSANGKISALFDVPMEYKFISPQKLLVAGSLLQNINTKLTGLYYFDANSSEIKSIRNEWDYNFSALSLSPSSQYLYYKVQDQMCIAVFDLEQLGECDNLTAKLSEQYSSERYYYEGEWYIDKEKYVITVRDREEHYEVPAEHEQQPPVRIQKEVARLVYDPANKSITDIGLAESVILKTSSQLVEGVGDSLTYFNENFEFVYDHKRGTVGIKEKNTDRQALLSDAPYLGDIPAFEIYIQNL